jgi:hypothetical protein
VINFGAWNSTGDIVIPYEYFVIKDFSASLPDLEDVAIVEKLMMEKKIFQRGWAFACGEVYNGRPQMVKIKMFNVALEEDEYLLFGILPKRTSAAATMVEYYEREMRQLDLD